MCKRPTTHLMVSLLALLVVPAVCVAQASEIHGLKGEYFLGRDLETLKLERVDSQLDFNWNREAPAKDIPRENISIRWTGAVEAQYSELYTFHTLSDDGVRLWINDRLLIDNWGEHGATEDTGSIRLEAGKRYNLRLEYYQGGGEGVLKLLWSSPSQRKQVIPHAYLLSEQIPRPEPPPMRLPALEMPAELPDLPRQQNWNASVKTYEALGVPRFWLILAPQPDRQFRLFARKTPLEAEKTDNWRNLLQDPTYLPTLWTRPEEEEPGDGQVEAGRILEWDKPGLTFARTDVVWPVDGRARIWFTCRERGELFLNNEKLLELEQPTRTPRCITVGLKRGPNVFKVKLGTQGGPWGFSFRIERDDPDYRIALLRRLLEWYPRTAEGPKGALVHLEIARYLEEADRKPEALTEFRAARERCMLDQEVRVEADEAERRLQGQVKQPPSNEAWPAVLADTQSLLSQGECATADRQLRLFVAQYPRTPESIEALVRRGQLRQSWGFGAESLTFYDRAVREAPRHPEVIRAVLPILDVAYRHSPLPYSAETTPSLPSLLEAARRQFHSDTAGDVQRARRNLDEAWNIGADLFLPAPPLGSSLRHIGTAVAIRQLAEQMDGNVLDAYVQETEVQELSHKGSLQETTDPSELVDLAAQYPRTTVSIEALNRAANAYLDMGRWSDAESLLDRLSDDAASLKQAGWIAKAAAKKVHLQVLTGDGQLTSDDSRLLDAQLKDQTLVYCGKELNGKAFLQNQQDESVAATATSTRHPSAPGLSTLNSEPSRSGFPEKALPADLHVAWRASLPLSPVHLRACEQVNQHRPMLRYPIVAEGRIFVAQPESIHAFDLENGQLRWQIRFDASDPTWPTAFGGFPVSCPSYVDGLLFLRTIEDGESELRAYSAADGTLRWRSGMQRELSGLLWLGDPAVACASVFAVFIERVANGPSRHGVACLDARTGAVKWKRYVLSGHAEWRVGSEYWLPSLYQGPPAVAKGVVYAATGLRSLVALDAFTGRPLWLTAYTAPASGDVSDEGGFRPSLTYLLGRGASILQVRDESVFLAPKDAPGLFALDARNGAMQWEHDLSDALHLLPGPRMALCATGRQVMQLNPTDGSLVTRFPILETLPGCSAVAGTQLYLCDRDQLHILEPGASTPPTRLTWKELGVSPAHSCVAFDQHLLLLGDEEMVLLSGKGNRGTLTPLEQARTQAERGNWAEAGRRYAVAMRRQPEAFLDAITGWATAHLRMGFERRALAELDYWLTDQPEHLIAPDGLWEVSREALRAGLRARLGQPLPPPRRNLPRGLSGVLAFAGHIPMREPQLILPENGWGHLIFAAERHFLRGIELGLQPGVQWRTYHGLESPNFTVGPTVVLVWNPTELVIVDRLTGEPLHRLTVQALQKESPNGHLDRLVAAAVDRDVVVLSTQDVLLCVELATEHVRWLHVAKDRKTRHLGLLSGRAVEVCEGKAWTYRAIDLESGKENVSRSLATRPIGHQFALSPDDRSLAFRTDEEHIACLDLASGDWRWKTRLRKLKREGMELDWGDDVVRCHGEEPGDEKAPRRTIELRAQDGEALREYATSLWPVDSDFLRCVNRENEGLELQRLHPLGITGAEPQVLWQYGLSSELSRGGTLCGVFPDDREERVHLLFSRGNTASHFVLRTFDWPRGHFVHEEVLPGEPIPLPATRKARNTFAGTFEDLFVYAARDGIYLYRGAGATRREAAALLDRQLPYASTCATRATLRRARVGVDPPMLHVLRGPDALRLWAGNLAWEHADPLTLDSNADFVPLREGAEWRGPDDLSARAQILWNSTGLLIAVSTTDDLHVPAPPGAPLESGDALRLVIDATADWRGGPDPDAQWSATLAWANGRTAFRPDHPFDIAPDSAVEGSAIPLSNGRGVRYELLVPWALLRRASSLRPGAARQIRLGLAIFDNDGAGVQGAMEWGAGTTSKTTFTPWLGELSLLDISREWMERYREVIAKLPDAPETLFFLRRLVLSHRGPLAASNRVAELESFIKSHPTSPNVVPVLQMLYNAYKDLATPPQSKLAGLAKSAGCQEQLVRQLENWPHPTEPGTGLQGEYFDNRDFTGLRAVRVDPALNFGWGAKGPVEDMAPTGFSVRWTGLLSPRFSEEYTFHTLSDDGVRLWVDDRLLIDNWTDHPTSEDRGRIILTAGVLYDVKVEYFQGLGGACLNLLWSSRSQPKEVIPAACLYPSGIPFLPPPHYQVDPGQQREGYRQAALLLAATPEGLLFFNRLLETFPENAYQERIQECEAYLRNRPNALHAGTVLRKLLEWYPKAGREPVATCQALMQSCRVQQDVQREFYREYVPAWSRWHLIGPFTSVSLESAMEQALPPERMVDLKGKTTNGGDAKIGWEEIPAGKVGGNGFVDLKHWLIEPLPKNREKEFENVPRVAYAFRKIRVTRQRRALFLYGAQQSISIWLNGKPVAKQETPGPDKDAHALDITLKEGENEILLKVGATGDRWGFYFRAADPSGCPLPDVPAD